MSFLIKGKEYNLYDVEDLVDQIAQLTKERDAALKKIDSINESFNCFKCRDGGTPLYCLNCANEKLTKDLSDLQLKFDERGVALDFSELACDKITKHLHDAITRAETAEAKCAEMRNAIHKHKQFVDAVNPSPCKGDVELHAVLESDQCGVGWLSPEKAKIMDAMFVESERKKKVLVEALVSIRDVACGEHQCKREAAIALEAVR